MSHQHHADHSHQHGKGCGHTAVKHNGHVDYVHDGHLHHPKTDGTVEERTVPRSELGALLRDQFGLEIPDDARLRAVDLTA